MHTNEDWNSHPQNPLLKLGVVMNPCDPVLKRPETRAWMNLSVYQPSSRFNEKAFLKETILRGTKQDIQHPLLDSAHYACIELHTQHKDTERELEQENTLYSVGGLNEKWLPLTPALKHLRPGRGHCLERWSGLWKFADSLYLPVQFCCFMHVAGNLIFHFFYSGHLSPCFCFILDSSVISVTFAEKLMSVQFNSNHQTNHTINKASLATHRHFTHLIVFICPIKSSICQTYLF